VARNVVVSETEGKSRYYAASFNLQRERGERDFSYRLNYTLSFLENNTEDINFRAMDANDFESEWGPSINDRRHIINGIFNYYPANNLGITLAALIQSGQPINRIPDATVFGTTDLNGDGASFGDAYVGNSDRFPGESRNNDRLPWSNVFDLGIQYEFDLGDSALEFRADIFNVFNAENLSGYTNNATQSNQIQVGPRSSGLIVQRNAGPPRQFQFGVRYLW
ncbi:MAG: TonB-dependent receptor, partial [Saprospiraceae bacterium]|nr:TonB-dependent receptor [Saprospiraceae bacterium]